MIKRISLRGVLGIETWSMLGLLLGLELISVYWRETIRDQILQALAVTASIEGTSSLLLAVAGVRVVGGAVAGRGTVQSRGQLRICKAVLHNAATFCVGVGLVVLIGTWLSPRYAVALLVGFMIWDFVAVEATPVMGKLMATSERVNLPNHFVLPSEHDGKVAVMGLADIVLPAVLTVAVSTEVGSWFSAPVLGSLFGACLAVPLVRTVGNRYRRIPAVPLMNSGALVGFVVASL